MNNIARTLQVTTPSDREILMTRALDAPRELVWDAFTKPELVKRWLLGPPGWTMPICEIDLRVGGPYRFVWRKEDGAEMGMGGAHREIEKPERLVRTELFDQDWTGGETVATVVFNKHNDRTIVDITVLYASKEARDGALASGMKEGMAAGYDRLEELLETA